MTVSILLVYKKKLRDPRTRAPHITAIASAPHFSLLTAGRLPLIPLGPTMSPSFDTVMIYRSWTTIERSDGQEGKEPNGGGGETQR